MRSFFRSTRARPRSSASSSRARSSFLETEDLPWLTPFEARLRDSDPADPPARIPALSVRVAELPRERRRRRARIRLLWQWSLFLVVLLALGGTVLGLAFAGSSERLPDGTRIAGVDVAGLTPGAARARLEQRERERGSVPVVFTAGGHRWRVKPATVV